MPLQPLRAVLAVLATLPGTAAAQLPAEVLTALKPLERVCRDLKAAGDPGAVTEVRTLLEHAGYQPRALAQLDRALARAKAARAAAAERARQRAIRRTEQAVARLAALLQSPAMARQELARLILTLDGGHAAAHRAMGRESVDGRWVSAAEAARAGRRLAIERMLQEARSLPIELEVTPSDHERLVHASGKPGLLLQHGKVRLWTTWPRHKAERVLRQSLRLTAVSRFLIEGQLAIPRDLAFDAFLLDDRPQYLACLALDDAAGRVDPEVARSATQARTYFTKSYTAVNFDLAEADFVASFGNHLLFVWSDRLHGKREQACLIAAHANWLCLRFVGARLPGLLWHEGGHARVSGDSKRTSAAARRDAEREEMRTLASAGFAGARSWLRWLVAHDEDPPFSAAFVDRVGKVSGDALLKATFVLDHLYGFGPLEPVLAGTRKTVDKPVGDVIAAFEKVLGKPLAEFEEEWSRWLVGNEAGLLQRLTDGGAREATPGEKAVLQILGSLRRTAFADMTLPEIRPVGADAELAAGADAHVAYLRRHPEQLAAWPDAHEEYPDAEGFSPAGSLAGLHGVIASGVRDPADAFHRWMGTFYHRLPLLEPGLLRVGWAEADGVAVLDCASVVRPIDRAWQVRWPADGMRGVPTTFEPELPNPVPGEDQTRWGYPITLQLRPAFDEPGSELTMQLREGSATGPAVDCWFSSPQAPTNPRCAPDNAWCLIPKEHLKKGTDYHVEVRFLRRGDTVSWTFRT